MGLSENAFREDPMIEAAIVECKASAVVVEGPGLDASFLSEWLAAAVQVQAAWDAAGKGPDGELYKDVLYGELIEFGLWAIDFISRLRRSNRAVAAILPFAEDEESHYFALMVGLGFFEAAADHYRMAAPNDFPPITIRCRDGLSERLVNGLGRHEILVSAPNHQHDVD